MENRPILIITLSANDKYIEFCGWAGVSGLWMMSLLLYNSLNDLILPVVSTVLVIALSILIRFPHKFNYPVPITPSNALAQYSNATRAVRFFKFLIPMYSLLILSGFKGMMSNFRFSSLVIILVIFLFTFLPLIFFIRNSFKLKA